MDNSLSAPAIRQMFLDFFTEKVGHGHGRVVVGVRVLGTGQLASCMEGFHIGGYSGIAG